MSWLYQNKPFTQNEPYIAFVYEIKNLDTGRSYVGKKQFYARKNKKKVVSDWQTYTGSNVELNGEIKLGANIEKHILHLLTSKGAASYLEMKEQIERGVLLDDGYYNRFVGGKIHANHVKELKVSNS